jgi:hypothetical protein
MNDYRLYFMSAEDHVLRAEDIQCEDDAAALEAARILDHAAVIEIWCGTRLVGRVRCD